MKYGFQALWSINLLFISPFFIPLWRGVEVVDKYGVINNLAIN